MASGEHDLSDDADDNDEVSAETTKQAGQGSKALPWMIAKARHKVKKHGSKASKHGAGGGKAKKKVGSRTRPDGEQDGTEVDGDADLSTVAQHDPASSVSGTDAANKRQSVADEQTDDSKKTTNMLRETVHSVYVMHAPA